MKRIYFILSMLLGLVLNSCGYYCYISSIGSTPPSKSYYILPNNPNLIDDLEFIQYAGMLTSALNRVGYRNVSDEQADIIIYFDWQIGNISTESGVVPYTYNTYSTAVSTNMVSTPYGLYPYTTASTITTPHTSYITYSEEYSPVVVHVIAVDKQTRKQVWKTTITDKLEYERTTMSKLLPVMLYAGSKYFGTTTEGRVDLSQTEVYNQGIDWPY